MRVTSFLFLLPLLGITACGRKPASTEKKHKSGTKVCVLDLPHVTSASYNRKTHLLSWQPPRHTTGHQLTGYAIYRYHTDGFIPPTPFCVCRPSPHTLLLRAPLAANERLALRPLYGATQGRLTLVISTANG